MLMKALQNIRPSVSSETCVSGSKIIYPEQYWPVLQRKCQSLDLPEIPDWAGIRASKKPNFRQCILELDLYDAAAIT